MKTANYSWVAVGYLFRVLKKRNLYRNEVEPYTYEVEPYTRIVHRFILWRQPLTYVLVQV